MGLTGSTHEEPTRFSPPATSPPVDGSPWIQVHDPNTNQFYWFNRVTNQSQWHSPFITRVIAPPPINNEIITPTAPSFPINSYQPSNSIISNSKEVEPALLGAEVAFGHCECVVCFDPLYMHDLGAAFIDRRRCCKHLLHYKCLIDWASRPGEKTCPICRAKFNNVVKVPSPDLDARGWFNIVDVDSSGKLDKNEIIEILQSQFPIDPKEVERLVNNSLEWRKWDPDGSGSIDFEELMDPAKGLLKYCRLRFPIQTRSKVPDITKDKNNWFYYFDEDGSSALSKEEILRAFIQTFNLSSDLKQVHSMRDIITAIWPIFDTDGSGEIDKEEFLSNNGLADTIIAQISSSR